MTKVYMIAMAKNRLIKVGFTRNLKKRMKDYRTTNPTAELIGVLDGTMKDERQFQNELEDLGFKRIEGTEFFEVPKRISMKKMRETGFLIFA